jgi:predicted metal-binding membrane protein
MLTRALNPYQRWSSLFLIVALAAGAWVLTVSYGTALMPTMGDTPKMQHMQGTAPMGGMKGGSPPIPFSPWLMDAALFLASWLLMTAAMMLPTTLSMVDTFGRLTFSRPGAQTRIASFVLGYMCAWCGLGLVAYLVFLSLQTGIDQSTWLMAHAGVLTGGTLVLAGLYQFTPFKRRCLRACRSPLGFLMSNWRDGLVGALQMGGRHGVFCIGCCWALMLLMFAVGMAQLGWMLGLALLMFTEKVVRRGDLIGYGIGLLFVPWGLAIAVGAVGPVPA